MIKMFKNMSSREVVFSILSIMFVIIQVWLELKIPDYMSKITTLVTTGGTTSAVINEGIYMIICALLSLITSFIIAFFSSYVGSSFEKNLRFKIFRKVQNFGMEEIKKFSTSSLITRDTNDVTQVKTFVTMGTQMLARAPIMAILAIIKISGKEWQFSLITGIGVMVVLTMIGLLIITVLPKFKIIQKLTDNLNRITRENLTGIKVVRAFNAENYQEEKFSKANNIFTKTNLYIGHRMAFMGPVISGVMSGVTLSIYLVGAALINSANIMDKTVIFSDMVVFSSYATQVIMSFMFLVMIFIVYPRASVSMNRISEILEIDEKIKDGKIDYDVNNANGTIEFINVSFKYPEAENYILENINLKINSGETVAFIGSTGSGKSTLLNLVPRFYDVTKGNILIDGVNIKDMKLSYLHNKIGYVSQKAVLFKGTISSNIKFGKNNSNLISDEKVWESLRISQALDFVNKMDDKLESAISQSGTNVSGGQKQRIQIARAIAKDPEIYIFDDSFSALDFKTDYNLRKELNEYAKGKTKLVVSSRIGTIKDADKIVVLDNGKCVGIGRHNDLLETCEVYKEIALSQLKEDELLNE